MGANCCVPVRKKPSPEDARVEVSTYRNISHSPSWSFRCDNRTHIEDIVDGPARLSRRGSRGIWSEINSRVETERINVDRHTKDGSADKFNGSKKSLQEEKIKSLGMSSASAAKPSTCSSVPSSAAFNLDPSSSGGHSISCDPTSSRQAHPSPGSEHSRQVSGSMVPSLKSLTEDSSPECRFSSAHSISGNDLPLGGSQGGSPDGWSTRTFTELVASSQRERWSSDSENLSSIKSNLARTNTQPSDSPTCGICSKLIKERSPWSPQKIVSIGELSVAAVLVCGHVYHAECLENMTLETDRFEPPCPICTNGEKLAWRLSTKAELEARSKISRTAVADADVYEDPVSGCRRPGGKGPKSGASSSMKNAFNRPSMRRHFSLIRSRPMQSVSENESARKKGFWAKYQRD